MWLKCVNYFYFLCLSPQPFMVYFFLLCEPPYPPLPFILQARYVSAATVHLVESAETLVAVQTSDASAEGTKPRFAPEDLVSAARTVVSNTGQLIFACLAKADANSASMRGLNAAASAVRRHAERLIELTELEKGKNEPNEPLEPSGPRKATVEAMREVCEKCFIFSSLKSEGNLQISPRFEGWSSVTVAEKE